MLGTEAARLPPCYRCGSQPCECSDGVTLYCGDVLEVLAGLPSESVHCVVTSPPYWGLRDYGTEGQLGLEATPEEYVARMVAVFREVRRVLRSDGTCWMNMGDGYNAYNGNRGDSKGVQKNTHEVLPQLPTGYGLTAKELKPKDLIGMPWRLAFALQADGWWLRQDIIWAKPNPMPESVTDRCTKSHEYVFLLTKSARYFYDADGVREKTGSEVSPEEYAVLLKEQRQTGEDWYQRATGRRNENGTTRKAGKKVGGISPPVGRNRRSVWTISTEAFPGAHFATFPRKLVEPCVLAGTSEEGCCPKCGKPWVRVVEMTAEYRELLQSGKAWRDDKGKPDTYTNRHPSNHPQNVPVKNTTLGFRPACTCNAGPAVPCTVLDPFFGSGTTAVVARKNGCRCIGIELNPAYCDLACHRLRQGTLFGAANRQENPDDRTDD